MADLDLCYLPATKALEMFRAKTLSPVELLEACIARAEAAEPKVNAFTYTYYDEALTQARKAEAKYAAGKRTRALEGLPIGIKDESYIKGKPTSNGSLTMTSYVPSTTSIVNERILRAGAIVHARTATPEFSCAGYCHSKLWGVTRNPWNAAFTPGGSSGGSAASLAAGTSTLCTGSDIGGSVRIPASASGVIGYKPPYGRNPEDPPFNLDFYCHVGPLARTIGDAILLQNVMCGPHPRDIASLRPKLRLRTEPQSIEGWSIAYSPDLGCYEVDEEVRRNTEAALDVFRAAGAKIEQVELDWDDDALAAALVHLEHIFGVSIAPNLDKHADKLTDYARQFAEKGRASSPEKFLWSLEVAGRMYASLGPILEKHNVLVCPTTALPAVAADFDQANDTVEINGKPVNPMLGWVMTSPFNTMSRCPVLSVPSGRAANGVPTGLQIVGRTYCDADVFRAGLAYEAEAGAWYMDANNRPQL